MGGENLSLTGEFIGEAHRVIKHTKTHPPANQQLKWHNPFVRRERSDRKWDQRGASGIVLSLTPPPKRAPQLSKEGSPL